MAPARTRRGRLRNRCLPRSKRRRRGRRRASYAARIDIDQALAILNAEPAKTGVFTDFDGTLAPIVERPDDAEPVEGAIDVLEELAGIFPLVAVVSGRTLEDLRTRANARGVVLAGAYGRERSDRPGRRQTEGWETVSVAASAAVRGLDGVAIERKGAGIALHYRSAPDRADAVRKVSDDLAREFGLEIKPGRMVVELVVPGPGKGEAILGLVEEKGLERVFVAGDDWGDVEAFGALRAAGAEAVIAAVASAEAPPTLEADADLVLSGPEELVGFLQRLARRPD